MEGEIGNFILVWVQVLACLCYSHNIAKHTQRGLIRLFLILPISYMFISLPLKLKSVYFGSSTCFLIAWMANFKILLLSFDKGPLSPPYPYPYPITKSTPCLSRFLLISCLPIKIRETKHNPCYQTPRNCHKTPLNYFTKALLFAVTLRFIGQKDYVHPKVTMFFVCVFFYFATETFLVIMTALAQTLTQVELEPPFDEPYLSSSLQDFWGRRWNLIVGSILRPSVYDPVRWIFSRWIGKTWASVPAVLTTFLVSGLMHELILYNVVRTRPTWEITSFFLVQGVCLAVESCVKRALKGKFMLPKVVSGPLVLSFVVITGFWLCAPPILRSDVDVMVQRETAAAVAFFKESIAAVGSNVVTDTVWLDGVNHTNSASSYLF